jgi:hypothetical protein
MTTPRRSAGAEVITSGCALDDDTILRRSQTFHHLRERTSAAYRCEPLRPYGGTGDGLRERDPLLFGWPLRRTARNSTARSKAWECIASAGLGNAVSWQVLFGGDPL